MDNQTSNKDICDFIEEVKNLIAEGKYDFVPRRKNLQALAKYGLTILDAKEELLELTADNYYKGPKQDFDRPGVIWEFKKLVSGIRFYIKIKIVDENGDKVLKCIGFHKDDFI